MQFLEIIEPILKYTAFAAVSVYTTKIFVTGYLITSKKAKLTYTNSRISSLKLKLKTRLNQKLNTIDSLISNDSGVTLEKIVSEIRELDFNNSEHYATLISKISEIVVTVRSEKALNLPRSENQTSEAAVTASDSISPELDLLRQTCRDVYEFDRGVIISVIEIKHLTDTYIKLALEFNLYVENEKKEEKIKSIPEPIVVESLHLLEEIYSRQKLNQDYLKQSELKSEDEDSLNKVA